MSYTLYHNAHFGPGTSAMLVSGGRIAALGGDELRAAAPAGTACIDLGGGWALPGFNDSHCHLLDVGRGLGSIDLFGAKSPADIAARCADFLRRRAVPKGRAVYGNGWNQDLFEGSHAMPTRADLDALCPDNPLLLDRVCGHIMVCNTAALRAAGITAATPAPAGGGIDLGPDGAPNGLLRDNAVNLVRPLLPAETVDEIKAAFLAAATHAVSLGLTTVQSNDVRSRDWRTVMAALTALDAEQLLPVRIVLQCALETPDELRDFWAAGFRPGAQGRRWKIGPLKLFLDGSLGARTAWLRGGYADAPEEHGLCCLEYDKAVGMAKLADGAGMQVIAHAIGDAAMEEMLDVIEAVNAAHGGANPHRHGVVHCQVTTPGQWERLARLDAGALVQPIFLDYDHTIVEDRCGAALAATSYAFGSAVRRGVHLSYGTDAPVESLDVRRNLYSAITRKPLAGGPAWQPAECVTRAQALRCYTEAGAWNEFAEAEKGRLAPGYLADFTVFDRDLFTIPEAQIPAMQVKATVVGGVLAWREA